MAVVTNYSTLQTAIADYLARSDLTSYIPNFIQNCEGKLYRALNLRNEETNFEVPIGGGVAPIPYRFKALKFAYFDRSPAQKLTWVPLDQLYEEYPVRTNASVPKLISREGDHFVFGPASQDGTLKGVYYQKPRPLETTSETSADELVEDSGASTHLLSQAATLTEGVHTFSIYAKQGTGTNRNVALNVSSTNVDAAAVFDLYAGKITLTSGDEYEASFVEDVGSGWFRCSISFAAEAASTTLAIYLTSNFDAVQDSYTGNGTSGVYLWGAQCEKSPYPTEVAIAFNNPDDDFKNLLDASSTLNGADWTATDASVSANAAAPPLEHGTPTQNWYTNNAPEVLLYGSLLEATPFIKDDPRLPIWRELYMEAVETLKTEERNSAQSKGPLATRVDFCAP